MTGSAPADHQAFIRATASSPASLAPYHREHAHSWVLLGVLWLALATVLQLARQRGVPAVNTVWAEDGAVFLVGALSDPLGAFPDLYTGYLHFLPRLVALVAASVPVAEAPLILSGGAAFIVALLSLYVFVASLSVFHSRWAPGALAAMMIVLPAAGIEAVNNVTNLRWFLLFAAFWALLHRPRFSASAVVAWSVAAAAALSDPLTLLLLPLAVFAWKSGDSRRRGTVVVFTICVLVQSGFVFGGIVSGGGRPPMVGTTDVGDLIGLFGLRVAGSFFVGERLLDNGWRLLGWWFAAGSLIAVLILAGYGLLRARETRRWLIAGALSYAAVLYAVPVATRGTSPLVPTGEDIHPLLGTRYVVAPILFLVSTALLILDARDPRVSEVAWRRAQYGFLLVAAALVLFNFFVDTMRSPGPAWDAQLDAANRRCAVSRIDEVEIPITPAVPPGVWEVHMRCDDVRQAR